ncbi:MAG TPA: PAS domain S-box protein [Pyrinomonadaceae bacterium]|nr:PAS domain S-box protein [Pyrinomonadaceae bacterium]
MTRLKAELVLTRVLDASVDGILAFDRGCRYTLWNQAMERLSGMSRHDVIGKNAFEVFPFLQETGEDKCFFAALGGQSTVSENRPYMVPETGRTGFFRGYYSPLRDGDNEIVGGMAIIRDITEQKRAEDAADEFYQAMIFHMENSPLAVIEWDTDFRVSRWTASAERLFGWKAEEVVGKHVGDWHFVFDEDVDAVRQVTNRQRVGEELQGVLHNRNYTKNGAVLYCEWYNSVLHDEHGNLVSVLSQVLDVTARKLAEEERAALLVREREARHQAQESDRLKDEFLATLSHELRTPLVSILGWATMIRKGEVEEALFDRALETIERNARSQARLIDDLLDVSRIITGNLRLDIRPIDLVPVVEAAKDGLLPTAEAKHITLQTEFQSNCLVKGDPNRLRQVIWNLVLNAIKFTPRGGTVTVSLECIEGYVRLKVSDTGEGIAPEFLPYVFDRFRQAEGSVTRKQGGLGLGLAVVRYLVELHGGNVVAESAGPGQGSTFTVDLPLAEERRDPSRSDKRKREIERRRRSSVGSPDIAGVKVLLVEDDDDSRRLLALMLERQGADVISVSSSAQAQHALVSAARGDNSMERSRIETSHESDLSEDSKWSENRIDPIEAASPSIAIEDAQPFDVIISDIGMAEEDGYELMRKVRLMSHGEGGRVPAIALTGYATRKDRERALAAGYQLHIAKPVETENLVAAIASLVKRNQ